MSGNVRSPADLLRATGLQCRNVGCCQKDRTKISGRFLRRYPGGNPLGLLYHNGQEGYNDLFTNTVHHNHCRTLQANIFELSDFLVNVLGVDYFGAEMEIKAVYHDSCSAIRGCGIREEPRQLLKNVAGLELIESPDAAVCCGFGGSFAAKFPDISIAMAEQKVQHALDLGAEAIVSTDSSCLMHLQSYIDQQQLPVRIYHIADVLASGWPNI